MKKMVSIPKELDDFLAENPDLSCSKMLQSKIIEIRMNRKQIFAETDRLKKNIHFLNKKLSQAGDEIVFLEKENHKLRGIPESKERNRPDLARS